MTDVAGNNVEEEYLWSCTLTAADKEHVWAPEDPADNDDDDRDDPSVKPGHRLLVKSSILMPTAKKDEVSIIQVESEGYNKSKVVTPICAMRGGGDHQQYVDLLIPHKATFKLIQGEGPISLIGSHCVDFYGYRDVGGADDSSDENDETMDTEGEEADEEGNKGSKKESPAKGKGDKKASPAKVKKGNMLSEAISSAKEEAGNKKRKASEEKANSAEKKKK